MKNVLSNKKKQEKLCFNVKKNWVRNNTNPILSIVIDQTEPPLGMFSKKQWDYFFSVEVKQSVLTSQPLTTRHSVRFTRPFTKPTVMPSSSNVLPSM